MANKALTIDVNPSAIPSGSLDKWSQLGNTSVFIKNIVTPALSKNTNIGQLVSGIPTAFARVDLFKTALDHEANNGSSASTSNLVGYYSQLANEWRGLIACMALDYAHISVRRIELSYSDGKDVASTSNVYEPKGAFGNMLLRRRNRWCDQNMPGNQTAAPYINVIKYRGAVVGATAPESLLFTSTGYRCSHKAPWIDVLTGKFIDPLGSSMNGSELATLHAYIDHLLQGLGEAEKYYGSLPADEGVDYTSIRTILQAWKDEIARRASNENVDLSTGSVPPVNASFGCPFEKLFCHKDILNGVEGVISEEAMPGSVEFDPKNLLLEDSAHIARLDLFIKPEELKVLPILTLAADVKGMAEKAYFALPLSAQGLNVFGKNVAALVGMSNSASAITSSLKAIYDPSQKYNNLEVTLNLVTSTGSRRKFQKIYTSDGEIKNKDILVWPNFISPQWNAYFMYNEFPHNGTSQSYRAFPFVGEMQENHFRILVDKDQKPVFLSENGRIVAPKNDVDAELLVISDEAVADNNYKYEIYRSNRPFKGVRLLSPTGNEGGYLLINYSSAQDTQLPHDWMRPGSRPSLQYVRLGIDFGSTNTSIAYSSDNTQEQGFEFINQRVSLLGYEMPGHSINPKENQVFFFQGAGLKVKSNAIKSVLTLHDNRRLPGLRPGQTARMRNEREVAGGFPSFADNLPFSSSDENKITLSYPHGVGEVTQIHHMKWENTDEDKAHKSAFLRTLMLHVYATLFVKGLVPESIKWSYPSAMAGQLLLAYQNIWDSLATITPVLDQDGKAHPLNVSKYRDTRSLSGFDSTGSFETSQPEPTSMNSFSGGFGSFFGTFDTNSDNESEQSASHFGRSGFGDGFGEEFGQAFSQDEPEQRRYASPTTSADDFMPDDPDKEVIYEPESFYTLKDANANLSLSEAEAVANFISVKYGSEANVLNLCFDVGGSTTDISALFMLKNGITMIKQNSLRFAAQEVTKCVGRFPKFKEVLNRICERHNLQVVGLNWGDTTFYNPQTAQYFFDRIVSRLNDEQLEDLYREISATCPQVFCVNLYVTGLLMFYAGQVAHKLIDDLGRTPESEWPAKKKPLVRVTFAGKGSRLYQWLNTINPQAAHDYYGTMFIKGYEKKHLEETLANWQNIELPKLNDPDIKYEVSKGLAKGDTKLQRPRRKQSAEIIGELGFELTGDDNKRRPLDFTNSITPAMFGSIGERLCVDYNANGETKFTLFCDFFCSAARKLFGWKPNLEVMRNACRRMDITAYAQNRPEFRAAQREAVENGEPFSYVAPIIILEGMKFYEETLLNNL